MKQFFSSPLFIWLVSAVVLAAVVYGIFLSGSPGKQRALQFDQRRTSDLQQISFALDSYWQRNGDLPESLDALQDSRYYFVESIADPKTAAFYEYLLVGEREYELCAVFELSSKENWMAPHFSSRVWEHGAGRTCFQLQAQPLEGQTGTVPAKN
jgi:hypothetical protein